MGYLIVEMKDPLMESQMQEMCSQIQTMGTNHVVLVQAFYGINVALIEATALAQPDSEREFVLGTDASGVAISDCFNQ